ncbi:MAG: hypothetical protein IPG17_31015 [Sandaracinaceae bacterium]|jgi:hypothetical protein|nr:hypothetical protein [Sandaracinaceae bacterium]MBK7151080.1 hypothetical protein [Sandaracinaceae bacterium]MBK8407408.1 hypothetical protein [Sandaracinaceae bacterium]MBK8590780.1 hypothetical protein [Sandaracinaceae bacterium]MBP7685647.1 hypothetical protein [Deltaproteobacteria bacterium]
MNRQRFILLSLTLASALTTGCYGFLPGLEGTQQQAPPSAPGVSVAEVRLAQMPDRRKLGAYYCAERLGRFLCGFIGEVPTAEELNFQFDLELLLTNRNPIPLPVVSALVGFTAYPGTEANQTLGSVCMSFCQDPNNCTQSLEACDSTEPEIRTRQDFAMAAANFLIATALGERSFSDLRIQTIPAGSELRFIIRLSLDPRQMIDLLREATLNLIELLRNRQIPEFVIPYSIEGSVWVSVENFGRFAASFGPYGNEWRLRDAVN